MFEKIEYSYYAYMLRCADDSYYVGVTNDIDRRLLEHRSGVYPKSYTYSRRPVELVFCQETNDIGNALDTEKRIKRWSTKKKQSLIAQA